MTRHGDLVVVTAVVADRKGACDSVQILVAGPSVGAAVRLLRLSGYRRVGTDLGAMLIESADAELAAANLGQIFERDWLTRSAWSRSHEHASRPAPSAAVGDQVRPGG